MPNRFCATCAITMFVLSPSVETTTASVSSMPASRSTSTSIPWPTTNAPAQLEPSREMASMFSSITATSQPSERSSRAIEEPTLPQPMIRAFIPVQRSSLLLLERSLREGDDEHLGGRLAKDVLDGRREEARLPAPAGRRAEDDQIRVDLGGDLEDRVADRARAHGAPVDLHPVVGAERL